MGLIYRPFLFLLSDSIFAKLIDNVSYTIKGDMIMPKNYRVDLNDDTVVEIKQILEIGTKEGFTDINTFKENGEFDLTDQILQYAKIKIDQPAEIKDNIIYDSDNALLIEDQTQSLQSVISKKNTDDNTILTGNAWINVHIPAKKFITEDNLSAGAIVNRTVDGRREPGDQVRITAINTKENYQYTVIKDENVCLWADDAKDMPGADKPIKFDITKEDCIRHYGIDEVQNYTHFTGTLTDVELDTSEDISLMISENMFNEDMTQKYPIDQGKITGHIHVPLTDLNRLLAKIGYEVVKKN